LRKGVDFTPKLKGVLAHKQKQQTTAQKLKVAISGPGAGGMSGLRAWLLKNKLGHVFLHNAAHDDT
jgi:hypothetical protein